MKTRLSGLLKKAIAPVILAGAMVAFLYPMQAQAANRGGGGFGDGHAYSGGGHSNGRGYSNGGHSYNRNYNRGGRSLNNYRGYRGGGWNGRGGYYGRGGWGWRGGVGFGVYAAPYYGYGYAPGYCNPAGYYDQFGIWRYYPGCVAGSYGY